MRFMRQFFTIEAVAFTFLCASIFAASFYIVTPPPAIQKLCIIGNQATQTDMYILTCTSVELDKANRAVIIKDEIKKNKMILDLTNTYVKVEDL
jgi:hypothetical protein